MPHDGTLYQRDRAWHPPALTPAYKTSVLRSPQRALLSLETTISELTGPVFGHDRLGPRDNDLITNFATTGDAIGQRLIVYGRVLDEDGRGLPGLLVEFWQANAGGRYRHHKEGYKAALDPNFGGCGRCITDAEGGYWFRTIKPGAYPWPNGVNDWRPAHIHFSVFGQAFAQRLVTQMYFEGDPMIWQCPIVGTIPSREAIETLVAALDRQATTHMDSLAYKFDIVLRGRRQTLFENKREGIVMAQRLERLKESPSQTAGPYVHIGTNPNWVEITGVWQADLGLVLVAPEAKGERIMLKGCIFDGASQPLTDALVEIWQADAAGLYNSPEEKRGTADPHFVGWGRQPTDAKTGEFRFETIKPGRVPSPDGRLMAPHITVWIVARGINIGLHTRAYFGDEEKANAEDPVLARIDPPARVKTLVARRSEESGLPCFIFDIHLQGRDETVFFDI